MSQNEVREAARAEIKRRVWASERGKATRAFLREHPEVVEEFGETGTISETKFPPRVTRASIILELSQRARRKEATRAVKVWKLEHPEEAERIAEEVRSERRSG